MTNSYCRELVGIQTNCLRNELNAPVYHCMHDLQLRIFGWSWCVFCMRSHSLGLLGFGIIFLGDLKKGPMVQRDERKTVKC